MSRRVTADEFRLWSQVAATVRPAPGRAPVKAPPKMAEAMALPPRAPPKAVPVSAPARRAPGPDPIEPGRKRRLVRGIAPLEAVLDLHGLDQDRAERALKGFLLRAHEQGHRSALVITGRGVQGGGVLRRRAPEWLASAELRGVVAGFSPAHQKHGGEGALYVALKRKAQP